MQETSPLQTVLTDVDLAKDGDPRFRIRIGLGDLLMEAGQISAVFTFILLAFFVLLDRFAPEPGARLAADDWFLILLGAPVLALFFVPFAIPFAFLHSRRFATQGTHTSVIFGCVLALAFLVTLYAVPSALAFEHTPASGSLALVASILGAEWSISRRRKAA